MRLVLILGAVLFSSYAAIFEDQVGKFDWRKQLIGCPIDVQFDRAKSGSDRILVSTEEEILASLSLNTGEIAWRRILEKKTKNDYTSTVSTNDDDYIYTITDEGRSLRVWRKNDGVLSWEHSVDELKSKSADIVVSDNNIIAATTRKIVIFSRNSEKVVSETFLPKRIIWSKFVVTSKGSIIHVSFIEDSGKLEIREIEGEKVGKAQNIQFDRFSPEKCSISSEFILCFHSDTLIVADLINMKVFEKQTGVIIREIVGTSSSFAVRGPSFIKMYNLKNGGLEEIGNFASTEWSSIGTMHNSKAFIIASNRKVLIASAETGKSVLESDLPVDKNRVAPKRVFGGMAGEKEIEIVLVGHDCRVEMTVLDKKKNGASLEWAREESLMRVSSVEMVDLPLSESQQLIEDEFEGDQSNILTAFVRRIVVQTGQFRRYVVRSIEQLFKLSTSFTLSGNGGIGDFINAMRSSSGEMKNEAFERDYFNLRKVLIVSTLDGTVFGIDSTNHGRILWRIYLGSSYAPLKSQIGEISVPLFVQRTTAHYQLNGQAAVAFADSAKGNRGVVVSFDPMVGKIVERKELNSEIRRISLLPFVDDKYVHPLIVIDRNENIGYVPEVSDEILASAPPLHILNIENESRTATGFKVELKERSLKKVWNGNLGLTANDRILLVKGKPYNQKVHSQGRVLVNREVQYKYVNPNLAAIAALDSVTQHLSIVLIDSVSGQIVHSASVGKASGPVHMVHSENWIAYSYWSEKGRRTELGIIELYEGSDEQSQKEAFDSRLPTKQAPVVMTQSYIYAQGVDSMSVSETEQGLTTRSILLAHPCGSIHEVSRRLLDATRPMELTQAMREEMIIGYMPEIAVATEEMINYNQTVHRVRGIKAAPSGLESTSLVLAYGTDLFFTRLAPSGTFDILKDDFDHVLISLVLAGLVIGSYVAKRIARSNALAAQWA